MGDVEQMLAEIERGYVAIARREAIQPAFDALLGVVDDVFAIELADAELAKAIVYRHPEYPHATRFISLRWNVMDELRQRVRFFPGRDAASSMMRKGC